MSSSSSIVSRSPGLVLCAVCCLAVGCTEPSTWRVQAPDESLAITEITPEDLGVGSTQTAQLGQDTKVAPGSVQFPTGMAVIRVFAGVEPKGDRNFRVAVSRPDRETYWSQLVNDLPVVREVVVLRRNGLNPEGFKRNDVLREAQTLGCNLCLIYARIEGADCEYGGEYAAVLWDAQRSRKVASYRIPVQVEPDEMEADRGDNAAEARLRADVRQTLWELAGKHEPGVNTHPSPWRTNEPLIPRGRDRYRDHDRSKREN